MRELFHRGFTCAKLTSQEISNILASELNDIFRQQKISKNHGQNYH